MGKVETSSCASEFRSAGLAARRLDADKDFAVLKGDHVGRAGVRETSMQLAIRRSEINNAR